MAESVRFWGNLHNDYIIDGVIQWGPFMGSHQEDLLDEEWNCNNIVPPSGDDDANG